MTAILGPFELTFWPQGMSPSIGVATLNQSTDQLEFVFQVPEDMVITRLGFRQGTATGAQPTFKASLQGVSGDVPDGTIKGGGSPASVVFTPSSGDNNTWLWKTLDHSYSAVRGEFLSLVVAYNSGTIGGSNNCTFGVVSSISPIFGLPYGITSDNGSRAKQPNTPLFAVGSVSRVYGYPIATVSNSSLSDATTPDEKGNLLTIPSTLFGQYSIVGVAWYGQCSTGSNYDVILYDTSGNVLQSVTHNGNTAQVGNSTRRFTVYFDETTLATLTGGTAYRLVIRPNNSTANAVAALSVAASADLEAYLGGSAMCQLTTRTNAGSWTDDPTARCAINPLISAVTNGGAFPPVRRVA